MSSLIAASGTAVPARPVAGAVGPLARVMICDDSAVIRGALGRLLDADPQLQVVARAADGAQALAQVRARPGSIDVLVLDIEMPVMDGITALPLLLAADPRLRIIIASTLTTRGAEIAMQALRLGAADYLPKPAAAQIADDSFRTELLAKVRGLARLRRAPAGAGGAKPVATRAAGVPAPLLLAIGSSTGGPQALFTLVQGLGRAIPVPVVLTQHMPATFTPILAAHLGRLGGMPCAEAQHGQRLVAGEMVLAPGNRHLLVERDAGGLRARLNDDAPENFCRPAVDPMLRSASAACDGRVLMVMLTGMGRDGLAATTQLVAAGGTALAQDEATSVVWGMPGAIATAGLCHRVLPIQGLASAVLALLQARPATAGRRA